MWPIRAASRVGLLVVLCAGLAAPGQASAQQLPAGQARQLALTYAPIFHFDKREKWWPMSVSRFISRSELKWRARLRRRAVAHGVSYADCDQLIIGRGRIKASRLGGAGPNYGARKRGWNSDEGCYPHRTGRRYFAHQFTRPFDDLKKRPPGLGLGQGFYLNLADNSRTSPKPDASTPLYYQYRYTKGNGHWIRYFVMYGCSGAPSLFFHRFRPPQRCWHEGEWEGLTVFLGESIDDGPEEVFYNTHHTGWRAIGWYNVLKGGTHPRVWTAENTHAGYPYPDDPHPTCDNHRFSCFFKDFARGDGHAWLSENLINVASQPWYRFGGSWGHALSSLRNGPSGPGHAIRRSGFPSPWWFEPAAFTPRAGYTRWCDTRHYPSSDALCVRRMPRVTDDGLKALLDLDCPDATTMEDKLPERFFELPMKQVLVNGVEVPDPHSLDSDRDEVGCEKDREGERPPADTTQLLSHHGPFQGTIANPCVPGPNGTTNYTLQFQGVASGRFAGTFTAAVAVTIGPDSGIFSMDPYPDGFDPGAAPDDFLQAGPLVNVTTTFTVSSPQGQMQGTQSMTGVAIDARHAGVCKELAGGGMFNAYGPYKDVRAFGGSYTATTEPGAVVEHGTADLQASLSLLCGGAPPAPNGSCPAGAVSDAAHFAARLTRQTSAVPAGTVRRR